MRGRICEDETETLTVGVVLFPGSTSNAIHEEAGRESDIAPLLEIRVTAPEVQVFVALNNMFASQRLKVNVLGVVV